MRITRKKVQKLTNWSVGSTWTYLKKVENLTPAQLNSWLNLNLHAIFEIENSKKNSPKNNTEFKTAQAQVGSVKPMMSALLLVSSIDTIMPVLTPINLVEPITSVSTKDQFNWADEINSGSVQSTPNESYSAQWSRYRLGSSKRAQI